MREFRKDVDLMELISTPEELTPAVYQYYKNLKNRRIVFNQEFDADVLETWILPLMEMDADGSGQTYRDCSELGRRQRI